MSTYGRKQVKELVANSSYEDVCRKAEFVHPALLISRLDKKHGDQFLEDFASRFFSFCSREALKKIAEETKKCIYKENLVVFFRKKTSYQNSKSLSDEDFKIFMQMNDADFIAATSSWSINTSNCDWDELQELDQSDLTITFNN